MVSNSIENLSIRGEASLTCTYRSISATSDQLPAKSSLRPARVGRVNPDPAWSMNIFQN
jgi:hypothetical protein